MGKVIWQLTSEFCFLLALKERKEKEKNDDRNSEFGVLLIKLENEEIGKIGECGEKVTRGNFAQQEEFLALNSDKKQKKNADNF